MKVLLVYPRHPDTFWSFRYALPFISRKASYPPLGLLTVAALLPSEWDKRLVDLNVRALRDEDVLWADYVFISAMSVQKASAKEAINRCRALGRKVVAGGPLFTMDYEEFSSEVDHLVLNEAEVTLPWFLRDLEAGRAANVYTSDRKADITKSPVPLFDLIDMRLYVSMNLQYSRGCPFDCEFCNVTVLLGRVPRTKTAVQVTAELEELHRLGWRGGVFFVDDNFIGNKRKSKMDILPAIAGWMDRRGRPFDLSTETSINLADDEELMDLMAKAGFDTVFIGIESPNEESLDECRKFQNRNRDLISSVRKIQHFGLEVQGGFIIGFDRDPATIFERMTEFIQESGIVTAMVGLLNAPRGTRLYQRLMKEGRLLKTMTGDNTDFSMNFMPKMSHDTLLKGYSYVLQNLYSPKHYYARVKKFLIEYRPRKRPFSLRFRHMKALLKSTVMLGVIGKERFYYWRLFFWSMIRKPRLFPLAITFSIYGFHFRKVFEQYPRGKQSAS